MAQASRDQNFVTTLLAVSSIDGVTPVTLYANPTTHRLLVDLAGGGSGTVQTVAVATANGFAGTSDGNASAPTLTLTTSVTGILKGNGTAISAITVGSGLSYDGTTLSATGGGSGTVTSVSGVTDRITITGTATVNPTVDIASTYVGQNSITTLGTITTGVWNGTDIALADGGTGASLTDPGADRILFWDDSASTVTWLTMGTNLTITGTTLDATGGGSSTAGAYYFVCANDATAKEKAAADYQCDGTADEVQINDAIDAIRAVGGTVRLSSGTFAIAASINMLGNAAESDANPFMVLLGAGSEATTLVGGSNINVIATGQRAKYEMAYFTAVAAGSGDCISQTAGTERGNWQSWIHDVYLQGNFTNHTGWGLDLQSPFRMRLTNIEMNGVANGLNFVAHTNAFNPGNLTVDRMFIDLWNDASNASAIGFQLRVNGTTSENVMNLVSVNRLDIAGGTALTSSIGISIVGASASFGDSRHHTFTNLNIEDVQTVIKHVRGRDCTYNDLNYCRPLSGGTVIDLDSGSHNNSFENLYAVAQGASQTFNLITDANSSSNLPNSLSRVDGFQPSTVTINATLATNTIINRLDLSGGSPTIDSDITNRNNNIRGNTIEASTAFVPDANDGASLGTSALQFSDLFLGEGGVINWDNGDATLTQTGNVLALTGASFNATIRADFLEYDYAVGTVVAIGNLGASETFSWISGTNFTGTLDQNTTLDFSTATSGQTITLYLAYDGTAQRTITWTPTIKWGGQAAPTAPDASGEVLVITVKYVGTTYYGSYQIFS